MFTAWTSILIVTDLIDTRFYLWLILWTKILYAAYVYIFIEKLELLTNRLPENVFVSVCFFRKNNLMNQLELIKYFRYYFSFLKYLHPGIIFGELASWTRKRSYLLKA